MSARESRLRLGSLVLSTVLLMAVTAGAAVVTKRLSTGLPSPQASDDLPQAWAAPVKQSPTIDGRLDDKAWEATRPVVLGKLERYGEASPPSTVRFLHQGGILYVGAAGEGRAAEAFRQVRPDDPPGEDPAGAVPQTRWRAEGAGREKAGDVRLPGVHALLGALSEGELGTEAEDGGQPVHAGGQDDLPMVPATSPRSDSRTTRGTPPKTPGTRGVLRDHGQQPGTGPFPPRGAPGRAEVAPATTVGVACFLGLVSPASGTLSSAATACDPLCVPQRSERIT